MERQKSWLILARAPGLGPGRLRRLLEALGSAEAIVQATATTLAQSGLAAETIEALLHPDTAALEADLAWLETANHHLIWPGHEHWPVLLDTVSGAPGMLFVRGDPGLLAAPQLAIVGSRNPSHSGLDNARAFAHYLARCGLVITSGLATGIDSAAHAGALDAGGTTIAVCGTGLDRVYPAQSHELARRISNTGALISEFPPGTPARREHFPQRNRIIAALSLGTLVVEAAHRSGSLITAHRAIDYGREVFAIPGSIHNPLARGCHRLIREGAKLVESGRDILEELAPLLGAAVQLEEQSEVAETTAETLDKDYLSLLDCIGFEATQIDTMVERSGLTPNDVSSMLLILELRGFVSPMPTGGYARTSKRLYK